MNNLRAYAIETFICVSLVTTPCNAGDALDPGRLEKMLAGGDSPWIVQTFRRHPDDVLSFVDRYLEGGLKTIEDGGDVAAAEESFRTGYKFAKLANEAFGEVIFGNYAASFGSWSPQERKRFREGQAALRAAREARDDPKTALRHYEEALKLAEPLGDSWGMAAAYMGMAETQMAMGDYDGAKTTATKSAELNGRLRRRLAHIRGRHLCGQAYARLGTPRSGRGHLRIAWEALKETDDQALRMAVLDAYCTALEAAGNEKLAADLRAKYATPTKPD